MHLVFSLCTMKNFLASMIPGLALFSLFIVTPAKSQTIDALNRVYPTKEIAEQVAPRINGANPVIVESVSYGELCKVVISSFSKLACQKRKASILNQEYNGLRSGDGSYCGVIILDSNQLLFVGELVYSKSVPYTYPCN